MNRQDELWADQTQANYEARQVLGIGSKERIIGDLPDDAFKYAIAEGSAKSLKELDEKQGLENWYRTEEEILGLYFCHKCGRCHYFIGSRIGQRHRQFRIHWADRALKDRQFYQQLLSGKSIREVNKGGQ